MALTAATKTQLYQFFAIAFDAAPGVTYMSQLADAANAGMSVQQIVEVFTTKPQFTAVYPNFFTNEQFATKLVDNVVGDSASAAAKAEAVADIEAALSAGWSRGKVIYQIFSNLAAKPVDDATWGNTAKMMANQVAVAQYVTETQLLDTTDLATLQAVLANVTATSDVSTPAAIQALIDGALGHEYTLTTSADMLQLAGHVGADVVHGVQAPLEAGNESTYNHGDVIEGNGKTIIDLVMAGGVGRVVQASNIAEVDVDLVRSGVFEAAGYTDLGLLKVHGGINGNTLTAHNVELGTGLEVSGVAAAIAADYQSTAFDVGPVGLTIGSNTHQAIAGSVDEANNVHVAGGDQSFATVSVSSTNVEVGTVSMVAGVSAELNVDISGSSVNVGDVSLLAGDSASLSVDVAGFSVNVGDVSLLAGDSASLSVDVSGYSVTVGDVSLLAGDSADLGVYASGNDVAIGDVSLTAGNSASLDVSVTAYDNGVVGDITLVAGDDSNFGIDISNDSNPDGVLAVGNISITGGDNVEVDVSIDESGDISVGNATITVGDYADVSYSADAVTHGDLTVTAGLDSKVSATLEWDDAPTQGVTYGDVTFNMQAGYAYLEVYNSADVTLGDVTISGAETAEVSITGATNGDTADMTVGNITVALSAESNGYADVHLAQTAWLSTSEANNVGSMTVGDIAISANVRDVSYTSDQNAIDLTIYQSGYSGHGDMTVGDINLSAGSETSAYTHDTESNDGSSVDIRVEIGSGNFPFSVSTSTDTIAGDLSVGDVVATVGNGYVSADMTNDAVIDIAIINPVYIGNAGDLTVGNVSLTGGDFAELDFTAYQGDWGPYDADYATLGNITVGDVTVNAGESAYVDIAVTQQAGTDSQLGDITVGNVSINVAQDAEIYLNVEQYITEYSDYNAVGDLTVGDVAVVGGDNGYVDISISQYASGSTSTENSFGDLTVGDISVALSATGPAADNSGGSYIEVGVYKTHWYNDSSDAGNLTVGDVNLSLVDNGTIDLEVTYEGSFLSQGDLTVGDITVAAGDSAYVSIDVSYSNDTYGDMGDLTVGDINVSVGDNARYADISIIVDHYYTGNMGDLTIGDVNLAVGKSSDMGFDVEVSFDGCDGDMGNISVGDVNLTVGEAGSIDWGFSITDNSGNTEGNDIGDVTFGDVTANIAKDGYANVDITITDVGDGNNGTIGDITLGSVTANVGEGASFYYDASFTADKSVGNIAAGDVTLNVADGTEEGDGAGYSLDAHGDVVGDMTVGDISVTLLDSSDSADAYAYVDISVSQWSSGNSNLTVGNITLDVKGNGAYDAAHMALSADGDVNIGDVTVSGKSFFALDGVEYGGDNISYLAVNAGGDVTIGNVDFSAYEGVGEFDFTYYGAPSYVAIELAGATCSEDAATVDIHGAVIDLRFTDGGAASVIGSDYDDIIFDNVDDNVITAGKGQDWINIGSGGSDTLSFVKGDSTAKFDTADQVYGFNAANDLLDFNLVAATNANTVVHKGLSGSEANFIAAANSALNSTVKYYIEQAEGEAYVAVNYGSGDADLVIHLTGVTGTLTAADIIA